MANRVTAAEVKAILDDSSLITTVVDSFITGANALVTNALSTSGLGDALLKEIERWLSAHMISIARERQAITEEADGAKVKYSGEYGANLSSTSYGQMVLVLDTTGKMSSLGKKQVQFYAIESFDD